MYLKERKKKKKGHKDWKRTNEILLFSITMVQELSKFIRIMFLNYEIKEKERKNIICSGISGNLRHV